MLTQVRLVDGEREMLLRPRTGIGLVDIDLGYPESRAVVEDRVDASGTVDNTELTGASAVSMTLKLHQAGTTRAFIAELRRFTASRLRPYLYVADDEWEQERRILLRGEQQSAPISAGRGYLREVQVGWKAPDGLWESAELVDVPPISADIPASVGIVFPIIFPLVWPATQATGAATVDNPGDEPSHFTARLYGPCTAPRLINETTGERLAFTSAMVLAPGEYVEINTRDRSAYLLSDTSQSRLNRVDFDLSTWWQIQSGVQQIRYAPASASAGSQAEIDFRAAWL